MAEGFLDVPPDVAMEERDKDEGEREEKETMDSEKDTTPDPQDEDVNAWDSPWETQVKKSKVLEVNAVTNRWTSS